jgi:hypothetical protein
VFSAILTVYQSIILFVNQYIIIRQTLPMRLVVGSGYSNQSNQWIMPFGAPFVVCHILILFS